MATAPDQRREVEPLLNALHQAATGELLRLIDGFYDNIEDGLFELAYRNDDEAQRQRCFDLMRELRFRRIGLVKAFARAMDRYRALWFAADESLESEPTGQELDRLIMRMAEKSSSHFAGVLQSIAVHARNATGRKFESGHDLPISPRRIARAFVVSCRTLKLDHASIEVVQDLFSRFVLDGLGGMYGQCNQRLGGEGFLIIVEAASNS